MFETKCVGDNYKMLVTALAILVTNIHYLFILPSPVTASNLGGIWNTVFLEALFLTELSLCMIFSISDDLSLIVPPWQRIDLSSMSSTMSTLDPMALSSHCNRHFDVFFKTKPFYCSGGNILRFESLLKYLNMEWEPGNHLYKDKVSKEFKKS